MKKLLKKTVLVLGLGFLALALYANLVPLSLTDLNKPVHLKIFEVGTPMDGSVAADMKAALKMPGITASSINAPKQTVSVTFRPDLVEEEAVRAAISLNGKFEVAEKNFPPRPACPVPPLQSMKMHLIKSLRIF